MLRSSFGLLLIERLQLPRLRCHKLRSGYTQLHQSAERGCETVKTNCLRIDRCLYKYAKTLLFEENALILCIFLDPLLESLVLDKSVIRPVGNSISHEINGEARYIREHHESAGFLILELLGSIPLAPDPSKHTS